MYPSFVSGVCAAALMFALPGIGWAAPPVTGNVTGCAVSGGFAVKPGVPIGSGSIPVVKPYKQGIAMNGTLTGCGGSQMGTKGGLAIDGGTLKAKIKLPFPPKVCTAGTNNGTACKDDSVCTGGGTCGSNYYPNCFGLANGGLFLSSAFAPSAKIKWTNSSSGTPKTVATSKVGAFSVSSTSIGPPISVTLQGTVTTGAFLGQTVTATGVVAGDLGSLLTSCASCTCAGAPCTDAPSTTYKKSCDKGTGLTSVAFAVGSTLSSP